MRTHVAMFELLLFDSGVEDSRWQVQLRHCAGLERILMPCNSCSRFRLLALCSRRICSHDARMTQPPLANKVAAKLLAYTHDEANASRLSHEIEIRPVQLSHHRLLLLRGVQDGDAATRA